MDKKKQEALTKTPSRYHLLIQSKEYQRAMKQIKATYRSEEKQRHLHLAIPSILEEERKSLWKIIHSLR